MFKRFILYIEQEPWDELIKKTWNGQSGTKLGKYRFHGVPFILVADRGSIVSAKANQALFDYLRIKLEPHMPGNPRAKGAIEGLMHHINRFEARLKFQRPADLEELNCWALDWCIGVNASVKMRGITPRSVFWSYITAEQLRLCPEEAIYRMGIKEPTIERTAGGDRTISVDNRSYQIPDAQVYAGQKVNVVRHPYEYPNIEVHCNGFVWLCKPIPEDRFGRLANGVAYGTYHAPKHTATQKAKTEMEKKAEELGITWKGTGDKRMAVAPPVGHVSSLTVFGHQADKVGNLEFIERKGTPLDVKEAEAPANPVITTDAAEAPRPSTSSGSARRISITELLDRLHAEIGRIWPELNAALRAKYENGIEIKESEEVIRAIAEGTWHPAFAGAPAESGRAMELTG